MMAEPCENLFLGLSVFRSLEAGDINVVQTVILFISLRGGALPQSDHTNIK